MIRNVPLFAFFSLLLSFFLLATSACQKAGPVVWPPLSQLDLLTLEIEEATYERDLARQRDLLKRAAGLIDSLDAPLPPNVKKPALVQSLLTDLLSLRTLLAQVDTLDQKELEELSMGLHPLVEQLIITAGVPHLHPSQ